MAEFLALGKVLAHPRMIAGKGFGVPEQIGIFEILHDLVTKRDGVDIAQWRLEKRPQIIFLFARRNRGNDLVEIEIDEKTAAR